MELLLLTGRFPERSETFIYRKAVALARRGHHVTVVVRAIGDWSLYPEALPDALRVEQLPPDDSLRDPRRAATAIAGTLRGAARSPASLRRLWQRCRSDPRTRDDAGRQLLRHIGFVDRRADVVHCEFLNVAMMYPLAGELIEAPTVVSCRGSDINMLELQPAAHRTAALEALSRADAVHCVSEELAGQVARLLGSRSRIWVNRPAVATEAITARPPRPARGPLRLLATGRLDWKKGFDHLLAALAILARHGIDFQAEILGDGDLRNFLRYSIHDLGLEHRVTLAGAVPSAEVLARMQQADVFVLSSVAEGISNAVLEAMATGLPIVTTSAGGMAEAVTDAAEGFVVPVRDVAALADRIERLARDPALRSRMGQAARKRAIAEFSLARQVEGFEAIYRSVANRPSTWHDGNRDAGGT